MRTTTMFAFLFLFAFTSSATAEFVLDTEGNLLLNGGTYYILPDIWAKGGGLLLAKTGNETCPLSVVQSPSEIEHGLALKISSPFRIAFIPTNLILNISFVDVPNCAPTPSQWTVVEGKDETKFVKITGYDHILGGWFHIEKYSNIAYKLVFCPTNGDSCGDVGISIDHNGNRRLVITDDNPFAVVFQKVDSLDA